LRGSEPLDAQLEELVRSTILDGDVTTTGSGSFEGLRPNPLGAYKGAFFNFPMADL
jgi:hypothetical protein